VATGLSQHLRTAFGPGVGPDQKALAVIGVLALALTAATGLRLSSMAWNTVTLLKLLPLLMLSAVGVYAIATGTPAAQPSAAAEHANELGRALLIVVFALQGFEIVPVLAGSAHSGRAVPWATLGTLVICMLFYCGLHALCVYALPDLAAQKAPLVGAAAVLGGPMSARIVSIGQIISAVGIAFGQSVTTPRYLATLGRTDALGTWIGAEDTRRVPQRALWITTIGVIVCVLREDLGSLFALSSIAVLAQYTVATLALTVLAQRGAHGVGRGQRYWVLPALLGIALVARGAEARELLTTAGVTGLGAIILLARRGTAKAVPRS